MKYVAVAALFGAILAAGSSDASTFIPVIKTCAVGGEKFKFLDQASSTSWGQLPDGMRIGTGPNPGTLPQCPTNGLVMYREFDKATVAKLAPIVAGGDYQAIRASETPYYLAYWLEKRLGDDSPAWLLLAAGWEAKNVDPASPRARRYAEEFIALVAALPVNDTSLESIALRARAANALREVGRFAEAEALRASIKVGADAGGTGSNAADNRTGWLEFLAALAAPIARSDSARAPIDMIGDREAAHRCLEPKMKPEPGAPPTTPLTAFEVGFCSRSEIAAAVTKMKEALGDRLVK